MAEGRPLRPAGMELACGVPILRTDVENEGDLQVEPNLAEVHLSGSSPLIQPRSELPPLGCRRRAGEPDKRGRPRRLRD